jgi:hypothetical protein
VELEAYTFVLLRRGPLANDYRFCLYRTGLEETLALIPNRTPLYGQGASPSKR